VNHMSRQFDTPGFLGHWLTTLVVACREPDARCLGKELCRPDACARAHLAAGLLDIESGPGYARQYFSARALNFLASLLGRYEGIPCLPRRLQTVKDRRPQRPPEEMAAEAQYVREMAIRLADAPDGDNLLATRRAVWQLVASIARLNGTAGHDTSNNQGTK
jgi:hypothetical protein